MRKSESGTIKIVVVIVLFAIAYGLSGALMFTIDGIGLVEYLAWFFFLVVGTLYLVRPREQKATRAVMVRLFIFTTIGVLFLSLHPWTYIINLAAYARNDLAIYLTTYLSIAIGLLCVATVTVFVASCTLRLRIRPNIGQVVRLVFFLLLSAALSTVIAFLQYYSLSSLPDAAILANVFLGSFLSQLSYGILYYPLLRFLQDQAACKKEFSGSMSRQKRMLDDE